MYNSITIDSTNSRTELCELGVKYPTDKSPYNTDASLHKHAYTSIYNLLFSNIRYKDIKLGELGILDNNSMLSFREFFPNAKLYGFEWFDNRLQKAINDKIDCTYIKMNVKDVDSITDGLNKAGSNFDVLIEDIFLNANEADYFNAINNDYFSAATFIFANHNLKSSAGWNNDKILVLHRNDKPCS